MAMSKHFRGDFHKHSDGEFVASRSLTVGGVEYAAGDAFDKNSVSKRTLRLLYENRKVAVADSNQNSPSRRQEGTVEREEEVEGSPFTSERETAVSGERRATIVEGRAGWLTVEDENGNKVGNSTRDEAEAEEIKRAYEAGEPIPE